MKIYLRHVQSFGFKGGSIWSTPFHWLYYQKNTKANTVTVISNHTPQYVAQFQLTPQEMRAFNRGTIGITPPGCCNVHGRKTIENPQTIIQRDIKNIKDLRSIFAVLGVEELNPVKV